MADCTSGSLTRPRVHILHEFVKWRNDARVVRNTGAHPVCGTQELLQITTAGWGLHAQERPKTTGVETHTVRIQYAPAEKSRGLEHVELLGVKLEI